MAEPSRPLGRQDIAWLLAAALATCGPLAGEVPGWLVTCAGMVWLWRALVAERSLPLPPRWLLLLLTAGAVTGVYLSFRTALGKDPGVALLVIFLAFKLMETRTRRDGYAVVFLCYFLQLAQFFYSQSIATAGLTLAGTLLTTAAMIGFSTERLSAPARVRLAGVLLLQGGPFMLVLFLLFPRIEAPLWGLPADAYGSMSGLSDSMSPGSISSLSLSGALAFRVRFDGPLPPRHQLYWRGPVLSRFDGRTWMPGLLRAAGTLPYAVSGRPVSYEVTLEPHNRPWLFALELPVELPRAGVITGDYQLLSRTPVRNRMRYPMRSVPTLAAGRGESAAVLQESLRLPGPANPRTQELARELAARYREPRAIAGAVLNLFGKEAFIYTLTPPLLGENPIDQFLFETRRGFCEHYAAAFVVLMRGAGVPARVVTGYQGGEQNPVDGYLVVRQSDAHAWAEIWIEGEGWRRYDPTAAIAPSRIESGIAAALPAGEPIPFLARPRLDWLQQARFRWDATVNAWDQWVLGYNQLRQQELLQRLGMETPDWRTLGVLLTLACGGLMLALVAWAMYQRTRLDPVQEAWNSLSRKLARRGLERHPWEGPLDYARRVAAARPGLAEAMEALAAAYADLRYGARPGRQARSRFLQQIREFKP